MNILITGISGFVGSNLVKYFKANTNYNIYGLDIVFDTIKEVDDIYSWNTLSEIKNIDFVIHLAGKAHDMKNTSCEQDYFDINYGLTKKIYDWFLTSTASKFFMMSSVKAVADYVDSILVEDISPNPVTAYGRSKVKAEEYLNAIEIPRDKKLYIFRPAMIHGPGNKGNLNLLYNIVSKRIPWPLASYENQRSFVSIGNLSFVFKEFMQYDINSGTYNVADDDSLSTNDLIEEMCNALDIKPMLLKIPKGIINFTAKLGDKLKLPLNTERLNKLTENYVVSNVKLNSVLKCKLPISSREGINLTIKSFKNKK